MGRKPKDLNKRKTNLFNFSCNDNELMGSIQRTAAREKKSVSDIIVLALEAFDEIHGRGNYQTMIPSYAEGGIKSQAQFEGDIFRMLEDRRNVYRKDLVRMLRQRNVTPKDIPGMVERISKMLHEKGVQFIL